MPIDYEALLRKILTCSQYGDLTFEFRRNQPPYIWIQTYKSMPLTHEEAEWIDNNFETFGDRK